MLESKSNGGGALDNQNKQMGQHVEARARPVDL